MSRYLLVLVLLASPAAAEVKLAPNIAPDIPIPAR